MECLKSLTCSKCGGKVENDACMHCGAKDFTIDMINKLIKPQDNINNYYIKNIRLKIAKGQFLDKKEDIVFSLLLDNNLIKDESLDDARILSFIIDGKKIISYNTFKVLMMRSAEKSMRQINNDCIKKYTPHARIRNLDGANGSAFDINNVSFNELIIKELYEGYIYPLTTYYHELVHIKQSIEIELGHVSYDLVAMIKDKVISDYELKLNKTNNYYKRNYYNISFEKDAHLKGIKMAQQLMSNLGYKNLNEYFDKVRRLWPEDNNTLDRVVEDKDNGVLITVIQDEIFDKVIANNPGYLKRFPQLNFEYVNENGNVRKRTKNELNKIIMNYMDNEEVLAYLQKLINKIDEKQEVIKR